MLGRKNHVQHPRDEGCYGFGGTAEKVWSHHAEPCVDMIKTLDCLARAMGSY